MLRVCWWCGCCPTVGFAAVPTSPIVESLHKNYDTAAAAEVEKESGSAARVKIRYYAFMECVTHGSLTNLIAKNIRTFFIHIDQD
jgi:hypothetical protein